MGDRKKRKIVEFLISQKWFELSKPNFHQLLTFILTCFVQKKKSKMDYLPKTFKTSNEHDRLNVLATPL